jgi:hypothetical protein
MFVNRISLFLVLILCAVAWSINTDWIPNDANAPLPLSKAYRDRLRKLCVLIKESPATLLEENELIQRKAVVTAMCAKLAKDDDNIAGAGAELDERVELLKKGTFILVAVCAIIHFATDEKDGWLRRKPVSSRGVLEDTEEQRAAKAFLAAQRMLRFGPSNPGNEASTGTATSTATSTSTATPVNASPAEKE